MVLTSDPMTEVEDSLGYSFSDRNLLQKARTRKKYMDLDPEEKNFQDEFCLRGDWLLRWYLLRA